MWELHQEVNSGSRNVTRVMKTFIATTVQTIEVTDIALISLKQKKKEKEFTGMGVTRFICGLILSCSYYQTFLLHFGKCAMKGFGIG